jgi:hypothetical protein
MRVCPKSREVSFSLPTQFSAMSVLQTVSTFLPKVLSVDPPWLYGCLGAAMSMKDRRSAAPSQRQQHSDDLKTVALLKGKQSPSEDCLDSNTEVPSGRQTETRSPSLHYTDRSFCTEDGRCRLKSKKCTCASLTSTITSPESTSSP